MAQKFRLFRVYACILNTKGVLFVRINRATDLKFGRIHIQIFQSLFYYQYLQILHHRYNISTDDYDPVTTNSSYNENE